MDTTVTYRKPGILNRILYFVLLLIAIYILTAFMLKGIGTDAALRLFMLQEIDNKAGEIRIIFQETLFQRLYEPMEALYKINLRQAKSKFSAITSDYPEITEIAILSKKGKYSPLFSKIKSETVRAKIAQTAPIVFDTSRWVGSSYFSDTTFNLKHNYLNIEGEDYFFQFISKEDKIVVEVSDFSIFKSLLPNIDQLMKEKNRRFYDTYFSRYPGEYTAEIKFYDQKGENFFTFGNPKGFGWKETQEIANLPYFPWRITMQLFSRNENKLKMVESISISNWRWVWRWVFSKQLLILIEYIIGLILIIILVHFSPRIHGFRLKKEAHNLTSHNRQ